MYFCNVRDALRHAYFADIYNLRHDLLNFLFLLVA